MIILALTFCSSLSQSARLKAIRQNHLRTNLFSIFRAVESAILVGWGRFVAF